MDEILDDEKLEIKRNNSFLKWWEGKRRLFNIFISVLFFVGFVILGKSINFEIFLLALKFFIVYLLILNVSYSIFSIISYAYKLVLGNGKKNTFFQSRILWKFLFIIQLSMAILGCLIIIGGASAFAPFRPSIID